MRIKDTIALVTGASSGIGRATARALARGGSSNVLLLARNEERLHSVAEEIHMDGATPVLYSLDLSDAVAVARVAGQIEREVGTPDILVNSAGGGRWLSVEETSADEAAEMMMAPYLAAFFVTREFLPAMVRRDSGHIVNVTSAAAFRGLPGAAAYSAARYAMRGFSESLAAELQGTGIGVSLYASSTVVTPYFDENPDTYARIPRITSILVRRLSPQEVGEAIVRGIEREQRLIVIPFMMRVLLFFDRLFPALVGRLVVATGWKRG